MTVGQKWFARRNTVSGGIFVAIALAFGVEASRYSLGSPLRMGPGFMPLALACVLAVLGAITFVVGLREDENLETTPVPWVAMGLILTSLLIFGFFARQLGLVPVVFVCTILTALASKNNSILSSLIIAACLSAASYLIFKVGLGMTLPTFGPLFRF